MKSFGVLTGLCFLSSLSVAQIKLPGGGGIKIDLGSGLENLFKAESPLTTSPKDMYEGLHTLDGWNPDFKILTNADKTGGKFILKPGAYRMTLHAFCGKGYAKGPSKGMGYGVADWKGKQADILQKLVRKYDPATVPQNEAQMLIWSILARVKPSKMNQHMQAQLALLVEPKDIARLEGYSLDSLSEEAMAKLQGKVDDSMRPFYNAENQFRGMMYQATQNFGDIERLMVPIDENLPSSINQGRWIPHPKGYLFRMIPHGYPRFDYEVVVPEKPKITRDDKGRITRLECPAGFISEVEYDDNVAPFKVPDEAKLVGYAIKKVRYINPGFHPGESPNSKEFDVRGCVLKGTYSGKKKKSAPTSFMGLLASIAPGFQEGGLDRWRDRYETGRGAYDDYQEYRGYYDRYRRIEGGTASADDFLDTSHYTDGLWSAITGGGLGWIAEHHARQAEALAAATQAIDRLPGDTTVDPSDGIGMPGNPGGQRALLSSRIFD